MCNNRCARGNLASPLSFQKDQSPDRLENVCNEGKTSSSRTKDEHLLTVAPLQGPLLGKASKRRSTWFDCVENWDNNTGKYNGGHFVFLGSKDGILDFVTVFLAVVQQIHRDRKAYFSLFR